MLKLSLLNKLQYTPITIQWILRGLKILGGKQHLPIFIKMSQVIGLFTLREPSRQKCIMNKWTPSIVNKTLHLCKLISSLNLNIHTIKAIIIVLISKYPRTPQNIILTLFSQIILNIQTTITQRLKPKKYPTPNKLE